MAHLRIWGEQLPKLVLAAHVQKVVKLVAQVQDFQAVFC